jgi:hypothetical protein
MAINLDHVTEQITVTDTAANADLTLVSKGTGAVKATNATNMIVYSAGQSGYGSFLAQGSTGNNAYYFGYSGSSEVGRITMGASNAVDFATSSAATLQLRVNHTASAVNYLQSTGGATGGAPTISAQGSDTNIGLNLTTKGTGGFNFASSGNSIFSGNGGTHFRVRIDIASATGFWEVFGSTAGPIFRSTATTGQIQTSGGQLSIQTDASGTTQLAVTHTASAVNYVQVTGATTGNSPALTLQGSDANIAGVISTKGTGGFSFYTNNVNQRQFRIIHTASSVNFFDVTGGATGFGAVLSASGSDTNINAVVQPKGTGALQAQQTDSTATGGNARGANAVDWQTARGLASQVANGTVAVIGGGQNNISSGLLTTVAGGFNNNASGNSAFIGGGQYNVASQIRGVAVGGGVNTAAGIYNFVGGGFTNSGTANASVTTQSATMNGTTAVTLSGSNASIKVGQYITGTSIASDTYVAAISGTSLTLSQAASGSSTSTLSFYTPHGVVVGGGRNTATGSYSFIGGGGDAGTASNRNVASGDWSVVGGGRTNTASGVASFVGGGGVYSGAPQTNFGNLASGQHSAVVGGLSNISSGESSFVSGGYANVASGTYATVSGGTINTANATGSTITGGYYGTARGIVGNQVSPASQTPVASTQGASQSALLVLGVQTTDATATVLRSNTSAASTNNQVIMPNNSAYFFTGEVVAGVTGGGNTKGWTIEGVIKRGANAASTALVGTPTVTSTYADAGASTWVIAVTADTTNGGLAVTFTGQAATTIRTVARINSVEMTF